MAALTPGTPTARIAGGSDPRPGSRNAGVAAATTAKVASRAAGPRARTMAPARTATGTQSRFRGAEHLRRRAGRILPSPTGVTALGAEKPGGRIFGRGKARPS